GKPKSRQRGKDHRANVFCDFCEQEHYKNQCELRKLLTSVVSDFKLSKARNDNKAGSSRQRYSKNEKAHTSNDQIVDGMSESENSANSSAEDVEEIESSHFSKEKYQAWAP
ncbi:hypothetical protein K3495_g17468, partial [Podosphaera aphanis]